MKMILKNNENKNNGDHSHPDEQEIPLKTLIQEPANQSDVTSEIFQVPGVNNEQETVPIYR